MKNPAPYLISFLLLITLSWPQEYVAPPEGGRRIFDDVVGMLEGKESPNGKSEIVPVEGMSFKKAVRFSVHKAGKLWDVAQVLKIPEDIAKDEAYLLGYWVRTISTAHESGQGMMGVRIYEESGKAYRSLVGTAVTFAEKWEHHWERGASPADLPKGYMDLKLWAGEAAQVVEVGGIEIYSYGVGYDVKKLPQTKATYQGQALDAPWRKEAEERIAKLRTAPLKIKVTGPDGKGLKDATVSILHVTNAFQFGIELPHSEINDRTKPENEIYRQKIPELFNAYVFGNALKWKAWAGDWKGFSRETTLDALKWAKSNGLFVRGHVMVWPGWGNLPKKITDMKQNPDPKVIQQMVMDHIDDLASDTGPYIDEWDVLNEPCGNHALMDLCGKPVMAEWFKRAREKLPSALLAINEFGILPSMTDSPKHDEYEGYIRSVMENGGPLDTIGMQGYFGNLVPSPMRMLKTLDRFGAMGPMIRITEYSIATQDADLECDFTRDLLIVLYSHSRVRGFHTWHTIQKFVNKDGTLTRLGQVYAELVLKAWKTKAELKTDPTGQCSIPAHLGKYLVQVKKGGKVKELMYDLRKDSPVLTVSFP